jgi:hypothetical protein
MERKPQGAGSLSNYILNETKSKTKSALLRWQQQRHCLSWTKFQAEETKRASLRVHFPGGHFCLEFRVQICATHRKREDLTKKVALKEVESSDMPLLSKYRALSSKASTINK